MRLLPALALAALWPAAAAAQGAVTWHTQIDNDLTFQTDRWYTSGLRVTRSQELAPESSLAANRPAGTARQRLDVGLLHEIFTPETKRSAAGDGDRPYAGRLLLSVARHVEGPGALDTLALEAGVMGPAALGRQAQDFFHRIVSSPETDWSRQLGNRFDGQLVYSGSRVILGGALPGALVATGGANLGTVVTFAHASLEWRSRPDAPASALLRFAATPPAPRSARGDFTFFLGAGERAVLRNRLLVREDDDPRAGVTREKWVLRVAGGFIWTRPWGSLGFALAQDSAEFEGQRVPQRFGSLTLAIPFD